MSVSSLVTLSTFEQLDIEYLLVCKESLEFGMKQCSLRVPAIVQELSNRFSSCVFSLSYSSNVQYSKLTPGMLLEAHW